MGMLFDFDPEKNNKLITERQISFEEITAAIYSGALLDIIEHPNKNKYKHQKMFVVCVNNYVYLVPFVETGDIFFLKTIFPSRKFTKQYLGDK